MLVSREIRIPAPGVKSLCWHGEMLVDWVAGGACYRLDGTTQRPCVSYSYAFDAAVVSPSGEYEVIYTRLGTKGLVLRQGKIIREINRSFYHADAYEYPIIFVRLRSGQEVMAHCPKQYNQLEIDDLATGQRLTRMEARTPSDYFFSRLATNADGTFLLSAGWVWHPKDNVRVFRIEDALKDPSHLDSRGLDLDLWADDSSACFGADARLTVWLSDEFDKDDEDSNRKEWHPFGVLRIMDLDAALISEVYPQARVGTMGPLGKYHVVGFYEHPRAFDLRTGTVIHEWPHLSTGKQSSSIILATGSPPPMAFDAKNLRFAVADETGIVVVQCTLPDSE